MSSKNYTIQSDSTQNYFENIISLLPGHIYWKDLNCRFLGCNNLQAKAVGLKSHKEIIGKTAYDVIAINQPEEKRREQADEIDSIDRKVMRTGETFILEEPLTLEDGSKRIFLSQKVPLRDNGGNIVGILGISIDITPEKEVDKLRNEMKVAQKKLEGMTLVSASIAHELRTPLATISLNAGFLESFMPPLIEAYGLAKKEGLDIATINSKTLNELEDAPRTIEKVVHAGFKFIDILLMNVSPKLNAKIETFFISHCIDEALADYPFQDGQRELIRWNLDNDFVVKGSELLITHILFNLIRNALYYIAKSGKGDITIWLERKNQKNLLFFEDGGEGISKDVLPDIFDRFFTQTRHGAGIGLTFCKMAINSIGGNITCESQEGEYTRFILKFPEVSKGC